MEIVFFVILINLPKKKPNSKKSYFQAETRDGTDGQNPAETANDAPRARTLAEAQAWRELLRPPAVLYILGQLCTADHPVHIIVAVWFGTCRS